MPLVAVDTNVVDLMVDAAPTVAHEEAMESMNPPPPYPELTGPPSPNTRSVACYWLLALGPAWTSTLLTFSDLLYVEQLGAPAALMLQRYARWRCGRGTRTSTSRPDPLRTPDLAEVGTLGIDAADARHVADTVGLGCDVMLTFDRALLAKGEQVAARWGLKLQLPSQFLSEAVKAGAPWPTRAPRPWED